MKDRILGPQQLCRELAPLRDRGLKIVFTNGCFDLLHVGHVRYLSRARELGDLLVVAINTDDSVRRLKGPSRPLQSQADRAEILAALESVDYVTFFEEDTPLAVITLLQPDVLVKGGDWPLQEIVGREVVESKGGIVVSLPYVKGASTTRLIDKALSG
jgi:D-beta-D-heptose 7-phosphate kinase/D-beta-D-heptose 1-phosphate adenosyltransferase